MIFTSTRASTTTSPNEQSKDLARRIESFSVTRRTVNSKHTNHPAPSSFVWALPYRAPSCRNRRIESSRHSLDKFITTTSSRNSATSTLGGLRTRGLNVTVVVTSTLFSPRRLLIVDCSTAHLRHPPPRRSYS